MSTENVGIDQKASAWNSEAGFRCWSLCKINVHDFIPFSLKYFPPDNNISLRILDGKVVSTETKNVHETRKLSLKLQQLFHFCLDRVAFCLCVSVC